MRRKVAALAAGLVTAAMVVVAGCRTSMESAEQPSMPPAVGDRPSELMARSEAFLTEYRFQVDGHSYALSSALHATYARDLLFIDDGLVCVLAEWRVPKDETDRFWTRKDRWRESFYHWEWADEPDGLGYLAALLREACGLDKIAVRRELEHEWGNRTKTGAEIAAAAGEIGAEIPSLVLLGLLSRGYYTSPTADERRGMRAFEHRDRSEVELRIWSLTLGRPAEGLAATVGVPDVQFSWPRTRTTVHAYRLGSINHYFVGVVDGRTVWIHADYPGLILQARIAAHQQAQDTR